MNLLDKECTGCALCANQCPRNAIVMKENKEGFLYPVVDKKQCDNCGLCSKICADYKKQRDYKNRPLRVKACQTKDEIWLVESTAGGLFPTLAQWVIEQNGVVFGTAYDENMKPVVCEATTIDGIYRFNGSKYVQSDLSLALPDIKEELKTGKLVLFSGTPCQVAAVKTLCNGYINKNLLTMDIVCYGVPSPGLFRAFLNTIEQKMQAKVIDYRFRDKHKNGWSHTTVIKMIDSEGRKKQIEEEDYSEVPYYKMFGARNCFRKECYSCKFNTVERISDFTTGNFWKIDEMTDDFDSRMGVSMLLLNTARAKELFEQIKNRFQCIDMTLDQAVQANDALVHTCKYPPERDEIYSCFYRQGFDAMFKKFYSDPFLRKIKKVIRKSLKKFAGN